MRITFSYGILFPIVLLLVILRLSEVIVWPWVWILTPIWAPFAMVASLVLMTLLVILCEELLKSLRKWVKPSK